LIDIATRAARKAGQVLLEMYRGPHEIEIKGERDIVTQADLAAEDLIMQEILAGCPDAWIISEESHSQRTADTERPTWYIDPLDGTTNFSRGLPPFSVSIAMAQAGEIVVAAVYDPLHDHLFAAQRGQGAFLNGDRLHVSAVADLEGAILLLDWPRDQEIRQKSARALQDLVPLTQAVRSTGSAALSLCYIAAGWADLYFQYTLSPWDVAAGLLMIEEAGGQVTGLDGRVSDLAQPDWLATNGLLHGLVLAAYPFAQAGI
jgi:myo-inositol-1(or 4)-monophosphatase